MDNDTRILRGRHEDLEDDLDRRDMTPPDAGKALLVQVVSDGITIAQSFFMVVSCEASGTEAEGSAATFTLEDDANKFPAYNVGGSIPGKGSVHVARYTGGAWIFRYDG